MRASNSSIPRSNLHSERGGDIVVITDGIGRASLALDDSCVVGRDLTAEASWWLMLNHSSVPDIGTAQLSYLLEPLSGKVVEFARAIDLQRAICLLSGIKIAI